MLRLGTLFVLGFFPSHSGSIANGARLSTPVLCTEHYDRLHDQSDPLLVTFGSIVLFWVTFDPFEAFF